MFCAPPIFMNLLYEDKYVGRSFLEILINYWVMSQFLSTGQAKEEWGEEWGRARKHLLFTQNNIDPHTNSITE